jgi:hypothetical protein
METKKCSKCGIIVDDPNIRFCEKCGVVFVDPNEYTEKTKSSLLWRKTFRKICAFIIPILLIIAAISIYCHHRSKIKHRQFEARMMLKRIYLHEFMFFFEKGTYSADPEEISYIIFPTPKYYQFKIIHADEDGFVARAWGNIDKDDKIDIWEVTEKDGVPVCIYDDVKNKGKEIDPLKLR